MAEHIKTKEEITRDCCRQIAEYFEKKKTKAYSDPECKNEIKDHPLVKLINVEGQDHD